MEYLEPTYHHFHQHHHDQMAGGMGSYGNKSHMLHSYGNPMGHQPSSMMSIPSTGTKTNETKPRLGKEEVEILEREFKKNPKPTTQTKRQFAEEMAVDLARINNWFQNRRAKRKQEKKQEAYEANQREAGLAGSESESPDNYYNGTPYFNDGSLMQQSVPFPMMSGPPPPVAPFNPQYDDPSSASLESLKRTIAAATASHQQHDFQGYAESHHESFTSFSEPLLDMAQQGDRAHFPSTDGSMSHFDGHRGYSFASNVPSNFYSNSNPSITELHASPVHTPSAFHQFAAGSAEADNNSSQPMNTFPSQLLPSQTFDELPSLQHDTIENQSPMGDTLSGLAIGFQYDADSERSLNSPPAPSIPFKSPPPMDIASRRKKANKPAALTSATVTSRPPMGPRTVSHAEGFRRASDSPGSPMRRVMSAGGTRSVLSGRINKPSIESAQRSPINLGGFNDAGSFIDHNYHTIRNPPSLTVGSSLNSSLAPPTPMSPRDIQMKREASRSTSSPESNMSYVFNVGGPGCFTSIEGEASPPETPQARLPLHALVNSREDGWPTSAGFHENKQWSHFDVTDEPLYTPHQDTFNLDVPISNPSYLAMSLPVTPALGQQHFNASFMFGEDPQFTLPSHAEYSFPNANQQYSGGMSSSVSPMTKQKQFQFAHFTAKDFSER